MGKPQVSVVSLTWNSSIYIRPMLATLLADAESSGIEIEIIVIDNGSQDDSLELIRGFQERSNAIRLVPLSRNQGTTVPRNIGIRMARADYVLVLDSDTEIRPGTLRGLLQAAQTLPEPHTVGIICPKLIYPNGEFQESARRFPTLLTKAYRLLRLEERRRRDETLKAVLAGETTTVDYAISAAWFIPVKTFETAGLLDEEIFYAPEDVEFCARVWRHGLKVWYFPKVEVIHNCQRLTSKKPLTRLGMSHTYGLFRYWWKYGSFLRRADGDR